MQEKLDIAVRILYGTKVKVYESLAGFKRNHVKGVRRNSLTALGSDLSNE